MLEGLVNKIVEVVPIEEGVEDRELEQRVGAERSVGAVPALPAQLPALVGRVSGQEILGIFQDQTRTRGRTHIPLAGQ